MGTDAIAGRRADGGVMEVDDLDRGDISTMPLNDAIGTVVLGTDSHKGMRVIAISGGGVGRMTT